MASGKAELKLILPEEDADCKAIEEGCLEKMEQEESSERHKKQRREDQKQLEDKIIISDIVQSKMDKFRAAARIQDMNGDELLKYWSEMHMYTSEALFNVSKDLSANY